MRLLILSSEFKPGPGGIGTHAYELASNFVQMGWDIHVITPQDYVSDDEIQAFNSHQPFTITRMSRDGRGVLGEALYRFHLVDDHIRKWQPDILMATGLTPIWLTALLNHFHQLPWVAIGHGKEFGIPKHLSRGLTCWSYQRATGIICVSQYTRRCMLSLGVKHSHEVVIPNGANSSKFQPLPSNVVSDWRKAQQLDGKHILLSVGSVTNRKGYDIVIRSLPFIIQNGFDVHYLIAGIPLRWEDPAWQAHLMRLAEENRVGDRVHFLGYLADDELAKAFNACDIFVLTSRHSADGDFEGYGIVVVEAALCEKPSIVSTNGGLSEVLVNGETGIYVPENDPVAVANAILSLLSEPARAHEMGMAALRRARAEQTWECRAKEYANFIQSLL